jgi:hypothetical protein
MSRAGWAVAAALGLAWLLRRRGDCQIWAGHAHVHSGLSLARAWELCSRQWETGTGDETADRAAVGGAGAGVGRPGRVRAAGGGAAWLSG